MKPRTTSPLCAWHKRGLGIGGSRLRSIGLVPIGSWIQPCRPDIQGSDLIDHIEEPELACPVLRLFCANVCGVKRMSNFVLL
jgi:hypothetical protein